MITEWLWLIFDLWFSFVSGDNECGKTTLIAKLQGVEEPKKGSGLEYYYVDVKDEYRDGMWVPFYFVFRLVLAMCPC